MDRVLMILLGLLLTLAAGCDKKEVPQNPIRIGISVFPGWASAFVAQDAGIFKKNGVNVELVFRKDYMPTKELLEEGEIDANFECFPDVVLSSEKGIPCKVVYVCDYSLTADSIVGKPSLKSLSDLKGKTVSFEGVNSFSHIFVLTLLETHGIKEYQLKFSDTPASEVPEALDGGQIDAGHTWEPFTSQAVAKGYKILGRSHEIPIGLITDVLVFRNEIIRTRPREVGLIVKSLFEALDFINEHRAEALDIMAKHLSTTPENMQMDLDGLFQPNAVENLEILTSEIPPSLYTSGQLILDFYLRRGQIAGATKDIKEMIDPEFVEAIVKKQSFRQDVPQKIQNISELLSHISARVSQYFNKYEQQKDFLKKSVQNDINEAPTET